MLKNKEWWDRWFIGLAKYVSTASKDPSTQVGAVIFDSENRIISMGYNGFPRGVKDDERLLNRNEKIELTIHAEINAILFANTNPRGCSIVTYPFPPCSRCAGPIINAGITRVISPPQIPERWADSFNLGLKMFKEAGVDVTLLD